MAPPAGFGKHQSGCLLLSTVRSDTRDRDAARDRVILRQHRPRRSQSRGPAHGKSLTVRERMEAHRANPSCNSCHRMIDPIGLALENFDVTGAWRTLDRTASIGDSGVRIRSVGVPIDTKTTLFDGTQLDGPASL